MTNKLRLDSKLVDLGLVESREKAKALIMAGQVYVNNQKVIKSGTFLKETDLIEVRGEKIPFVSRGGLKLKKAMEVFDISLENNVCMDVGASTGGFTDCMIQHGASKVYSIDVGYGQLAWKLRTDERVVNMERTNFRYVTKEQINDDVDFASVDVSFISLKIILPVLYNLLKWDGTAVCLIKPQFEAGKDKIGKKGVVREMSTHCEVVNQVMNYAISSGFSVTGLSFSPVKGPEGNIEYLMHIIKSENPENISDISVEKLIENSHNELE